MYLYFFDSELTTQFFFISILSGALLSFFIFLLFWLTNQNAMFTKQQNCSQRSQLLNCLVLNKLFNPYKSLHFCHTESFYTFIPRFLFTLSNILLIKPNYMDSNKDILDRAIGRPAMMAFMLLVGTYVTTGQLIPGIF